ncbi:PEP-CTERM sorting domain-containing protein [Haloferula sp.]|uniref:PEP-CTERM sorting domain-containing protein n=1 Tax=Haloferula sp. TaxID=2497595 RepID=UPI003C776966
MKTKLLPLLLLAASPSAHAVLVSLNDHGGNEQVNTTIVANGGYELGTGDTVPDNWSRAGQPFYDTPANAGITGAFSNLPASGKVAYFKAVEGNVNSQYFQNITGLEPNTAYVLSAYLWNNSNPGLGRNINVVMDLNDAPGEAQQVLGGAVANAAEGYFAYANFNTTTTGTDVRVRLFSPAVIYSAGEAGTPLFAWDNVSITKASEFSPVPEPSVALLGGLGLLGLLRRRRA